MSISASLAGPSAAAGRIAGRYRPLRLLARTASGVTWHAIDESSGHAASRGHTVVAKLFHRYPGGSRRAAAGRELPMPVLDHLVGVPLPGLPTLLDAGRDRDVPYVIFERAAGEPLDQMISGDVRTLRWDLRNELVAQLAAAVDALHWTGHAHLALTPSGILYDRQRRGLCLLDWGHMIPLAASGPIVAPGVALNALPYASAGLLAGTSAEVTDDIYAVGCIVHEVLTGAHPYDRRAAREALALGLAPPREPSLDLRQHRALSHALAASAAQRTIPLREFTAAFRPQGGERFPRSAGFWQSRFQWLTASLRAAVTSLT